MDTESHRTPDPSQTRGEKSADNAEKSPHLVRVLGVRGEVRVEGLRGQPIATVAGMQRGRISRHQLNQLGVLDDAVDRMVASRTLHRRNRSVYGVGHVASIPLARETEALLAVPQAIALSHQSAALVWGIKVPGTDGGPVHMLVAGDWSSRNPLVRVHRSSLLRPGDLSIRYGLPVTTVARTTLDLAGSLDEPALAIALEDVLTRKLLRETELVALLDRSPGRRGTRILRALLARESEPAMTRSEGERRMLELIREAGLPTPRANVAMFGYEADFYWPEQRLVVELDGFAYHSRHLAFERDHRKDQTFRAAALQPLRITGSQLKHQPTAVAVLIARELFS
jgi:very-short-patch-repair endonuclease